MSEGRVDIEAIRRRAAWVASETPPCMYSEVRRETEVGPVKWVHPRSEMDAYLDRADLLAEVERLRVENKKMRPIVDRMHQSPAEYAGHCVLCGAHHDNIEPHEPDCPHRLAKELAREGQRP